VRRIVGTTWSTGMEHSGFCVSVCIAAFLVGGLCGIFAGKSLNGAGAEGLTLYLQSFLNATQGGKVASPRFIELAWTMLRWPLVLILSGMTAAGLALIPALLIGRGFLLFFAYASLLRIISGGVVFVMLGLSALFFIPALLMLSVQSLQLAAVQRVRRERFYLPPRFAAGILAGFALCLLVEYYVVPELVSALFHAIVW